MCWLSSEFQDGNTAIVIASAGASASASAIGSVSSAIPSSHHDILTVGW